MQKFKREVSLRYRLNQFNNSKTRKKRVVFVPKVIFNTFVPRQLKNWFLTLKQLIPLAIGGDGSAKMNGDVAQLVEQRTENPCVGGSIPSVTT